MDAPVVCHPAPVQQLSLSGNPADEELDPNSVTRKSKCNKMRNHSTLSLIGSNAHRVACF